MTRYWELLLIADVAVLVYGWIAFPVLLALLSRKRDRPAATAGDAVLPRVAVVLSAYNEETHIADRIRNLLDLDYPAAHWKAYIGVDGSKDRTAAEAFGAAQGRPHILVRDFAENRGKVAVLKDLVAAAGTDGAELLVFTDANTAFAPDALKKLCRWFGDPRVGGVSGKLSLVAPAGTKTEEGAYWKLETWLKKKESDLDSCLGANGAIYAIRRELFWSAIPANTIVDDFVIGMKVRERGYRFVYDPEAAAVEEMPPKMADEWTRRVRIGAGGYQAIRLCRACLHPSYGAFAWALWSHKVLRWFTPHLMLVGLAASVACVAMAHGPTLGHAALALYAAGAAVSVLATCLEKPARGLRAIHYLLAMQAALFAGFVRFCRGNLEGRWQRTAR